MVKSQSTATQDLPDARWAEDLEVIKAELPQRHPDLFFHMPRETFVQRLDSLSSILRDLDDFEVVMSLREIIAELGDPHTNLGFYELIEANGVYPFELYDFSDGLHVVAADAAHPEILGTRLCSIGGMDIGRVVEIVSAIVPKNEPHFIAKRMQYFLRFHGILRHYGAAGEESTSFEFMTSSGQTIELDLNPVVLAESDDLSSRLVHYQPARQPYYWTRGTSLEQRSNAFRDRFFPEDGIYFVQYNECWGQELEAKYGSPEAAKDYPSFDAFADRMIAVLENEPVKKLFFDMRFNGGGSSGQGTKLVERLAAMRSVNQEGRLFVGISHETFSSAVINAMDFRQKTKALLVGRPAGGRPNHYGEVRPLELPHSKVKVYHSTKFFKYVEENPETVLPDCPVESAFSALARGVDPLYEHVKRY